MGERAKKHDPALDKAAIEREILAGRKFSVADAIGRLGGKDLMKGASPVTRKRQAELEMKHALRAHLSDAEGALRLVLLRRVTESGALLEGGYKDPIGNLVRYVDRLCGSDVALKALVREVDMEWGRANDTRPHFEKEGQTTHPDDPYTSESVRSQLSRLGQRLRDPAV